jgi:hypothetical protein
MTRYIEDLARENEELKRRVAMLEERIVRAIRDGRPPDPLLTDGYPSKAFATPHAPPADPPGETDEDIEAVYAAVKARALRDLDPLVLALLRRLLNGQAWGGL